MLQPLLGTYEACVPEMKGYTVRKTYSQSCDTAIVPIFPNEKLKLNYCDLAKVTQIMSTHACK